MNAKHTPGPWTVKWDYDNRTGETRKGRHTIRSRDGWNLARIWEGVHADYNQDHAAANARLMAAAPELLAALRAARALLGDDPPDNGEMSGAAVVDMIDAAIRRALEG